MLLTFFRWVHTVAACVWLGGLVFLLVVMRPSVQALGGSATLGPLLAPCRRRTKTVFITTVVALAVSGVAMLAMRYGRVNAVYVILLVVKIVVSVGLLGGLWFVAFVRPAPRARGAAAAEGEAAAPDEDFFFRPDRRAVLVQWGVVGATVVAILLGLIVARLGTRLAERGRQPRPAPAPEATE